MQVGVVLPHSTFRARHYRSAVVATLSALAKPKQGSHSLLGQTHDIVATVVTVNHKPSPTSEYQPAGEKKYENALSPSTTSPTPPMSTNLPVEKKLKCVGHAEYIVSQSFKEEGK